MSASARSCKYRHATLRTRLVVIARTVLVAAGVLAGTMGPLLMSGRRSVLPIHELAGTLAVLALWTIAAIAARGGVARGKVALAAGWGGVELALAGAQTLALGPTAHAVSQVLHVAASIGVMAGGALLARAVVRREAAPAIAAPAAAPSAHALIA